MKIMVLGFTTVGKTYFLASLHKLFFEVGGNGFQLHNANFIEKGRIEDMYTTLEGADPNKSVPGTVKAQLAEMILRQGSTPITQVDVWDTEGESIEAGRKPEEAKKVLEWIEECDGFIFILETPFDRLTTQKCLKQLAQMQLFVSKALQNNPDIPICLVFNKLDMLPQAQGIRAKYEKEEDQAEKELISKGYSPYQLNLQLKTKRGELISEFVRPLIMQNIKLFEVIASFCDWIKASGGEETPNKIFLCTSLGFDNAQKNQDTYVAKVGEIMPYGTAAAFLWVLYARNKTQQGGLREHLSDSSFADKLLEDITELHTSGKAYFDKDYKLWNLRNIGNLYAHQLLE
jgi:hypothetical protein